MEDLQESMDVTILKEELIFLMDPIKNIDLRNSKTIHR
jgi:hypothetical protein